MTGRGPNGADTVALVLLGIVAWGAMYGLYRVALFLAG